MASCGVNGYLINAEGRLWLAGSNAVPGAEARGICGYGVMEVSRGFARDITLQEMPTACINAATELLDQDYILEGAIYVDVDESGALAITNTEHAHPFAWTRDGQMIRHLPEPEQALISSVLKHAARVRLEADACNLSMQGH